MNKKSHSEPTLIFDWANFDLKQWKEAFRKVFIEADYEEHYKKMMQ